MDCHDLIYITQVALIKVCLHVMLEEYLVNLEYITFVYFIRLIKAACFQLVRKVSKPSFLVEAWLEEVTIDSSR